MEANLDREQTQAQQLQEDVQRRTYDDAQRFAEQITRESREREESDRLRHEEDIRRKKSDLPATGSRLGRRSGEFNQFAQMVFVNDFSETAPLRDTWESAVKNTNLMTSKDPWKNVRQNFWRRVNSRSDEKASIVADIIEAAGYELQQGSSVPILWMNWEPNISKEELERLYQDKYPEGKLAKKFYDDHKNRYKSDRMLSLDHINPQSNKPEDILNHIFNPKNIRFMTGRITLSEKTDL